MINKIFILLFLVVLSIFLHQIYSYSKVRDLKNKITSSPVTPYPTISMPDEKTVVNKALITPNTSRNIEVLLPLTGDNVARDFIVKGNAKTIDNIVGIRLWDSSGNVIAETTAEANTPESGQYGPFEKLITFNTTDNTGRLEIFQYNSTDGTISDTVEIPLTFKR